MWCHSSISRENNKYIYIYIIIVFYITKKMKDPLKDHVTLKTGVMMLKIQSCIKWINYILNCPKYLDKSKCPLSLGSRAFYTHDRSNSPHTCSSVVVTFMCRSLERQTNRSLETLSLFLSVLLSCHQTDHNDDCENPQDLTTLQPKKHSE